MPLHQLTTTLSHWPHLLLDPTTTTMLYMTILISCLVYTYTIPYLKYTQAHPLPYLIYWLFSIITMLWLIVANNTLNIFIAWELLGLSSYLCIYYPDQNTVTNNASTQAWLIGKWGSCALLTGLLMMQIAIGEFNITTLATHPPDIQNNLWTNIAATCIVLGLFTKSAQFPFCSWLPKAMVAPTPTSALLHTATMVSAGLYLLIRMYPLLPQAILTLITITGAITAFLGAFAALAQRNLKRMLAYATLSQLGYMMMTIGVGGSSVCLPYLMYHALAKSCMLLCAGTIACYVQQQGNVDTQDMHLMGGLCRHIPWIWVAYSLSTWALLGLPGSSLSKATMLAYTLRWVQTQQPLAYLIPIMGTCVTVLTTAYLVRSYGLIFMGLPRWDKVANTLTRIPNGLPIGLQLPPLALALCAVGLAYGIGSPSVLCYKPSILPDLAIQQLATRLVRGSTIVGVAVGIWGLHSKVEVSWQSYRLLRDLAFDGWYLEHVIQAGTNRIWGLSQGMRVIEERVMMGVVRQLAVGVVVVGHVVHALDKCLVDRVKGFIGGMGRRIGRGYKRVQDG
ncbi:MAG: proton-conducting transporter membrane subunit, partial [Bacteroidota bacterium]